MINYKQQRETKKAVDSLRKMQVRFSDGSIGRLLCGEGGSVLELPTYPKPIQTAGINPFSIYQQPVLSNSVSINAAGAAYSAGDVLDVLGGTLATDGVPYQITVGQVDLAGKVLWGTVTQAGQYSIPPDYPAMVSGGTGAGAQVTILSQQDNWRCFQIRSGTVGTRPKWAFDYYRFLTNVIIINPMSVPGGSPELVIGINCDGNLGNQTAPAAAGAVGIVTIPSVESGTPVIIYGYLPDGPGGKASTFVTYGQIILDNSQFDPDSNRYLTACMFWLEIIDDPVTLDGFYVNLMAQTCGYGLGWGYNVPFPTGSNIIPLGVVRTDSLDLNITIDQIQSGNAVNRWAGMAGGSVQTLRGRWTADSLSGQFFYPGDVIIDDSNTYTLEDSFSHPIATYQFNWVYVGNAGTVTNTPFIGYSDWMSLCSTLNP
jgi:hypothetical protein